MPSEPSVEAVPVHALSGGCSFQIKCPQSPARTGKAEESLLLFRHNSCARGVDQFHFRIAKTLRSNQ